MTLRLTFEDANGNTNIYHLYCSKDTPYKILLHELNNFFCMIDTKQSEFIENLNSLSLEAYLFYRKIYEAAIKEEETTVSYREYFAKIYNREKAIAEE